MGMNEEAAITISLIAKDLASGNIGKAVSGLDALAKKGGLVGAMAQGVGQSFGQMLNPIGLVTRGIGMVTDAFADGIKGALEEEVQLGRLDQALQNNVANWDGNRDAMDAAAESAMDLAFSDDQARESLIKLVTATGNQEESIRGLSLAMNIARGRNIDLASATDVVVKATVGNTRALKQYGIEVREGATATEILAELQARFADQAEEYASTTAGKWEAAQLKVNNAMEEFGHIAISTTAGLLSLPEALEGNSQATSDYLHALGNLVPGMELIADEFDAERERIGMVAGTIPKDIEAALLAGAPAVEASGQALVDQLQDIFSDNQAKALAQFANNFTDDLAGSLRSNKDVVADAMDDLVWAMHHPLQLEKEGARIEAALTSKALAEGLASNNPMIRAVALQQKEELEAQWKLLTGEAYRGGVSAADALERGLRTFNSPKFGLIARSVRTDLPGFAHGGHVRAHEPIIVGEERPELFIPDGPGYIVPSVPEYPETFADFGGGVPAGRSTAGPPVSLTVNFSSLATPTAAEGQRIAQAILPDLVREMRRQRLA